MKNIIILLSFIALFVAITNTYVVFAVLLHTSVGVITATFFLLNIFIIFFINKKIASTNIFMNKVLFFIVIVPAIVIFLTLGLSLKLYFLQLFYFSIFLVAYYSYFVFSNKYWKRLFLSSFIVTVFFGILSFNNPSFFSNMAKIVSGEVSLKTKRAFGFFLQPNSFAEGVLLTMIVLLFLINKKKILIIMTSVAMILLSGSRSAIIVMFLLLIFNRIFSFKQFRIDYLFKSILILFLFSFIIIFSSFLSDINVDYFSKNEHYSVLFKRFNFLINLSEKNVEKDASVETRLVFQKYFWKRIYERPILGYGLDAVEKLRKKGLLPGSSHNEYLKYLLLGGGVYLFFYIYFLFFLIKTTFKYYLLNKDRNYLIYILSFTLFVVFISFFTNTLFDNRVLFVVMGLLAGNYDNKNNVSLLNKNA